MVKKLVATGPPTKVSPGVLREPEISNLVPPASSLNAMMRSPMANGVSENIESVTIVAAIKVKRGMSGRESVGQSCMLIAAVVAPYFA